MKAKLREDRVPATALNESGALDFLSDQLFDGRKIRVLSIVDNYTRLPLTFDVRFSYCGSDVVETLECIAVQYGRPQYIRVDQGPEFILMDNAFAEPLNRRVRAECLNANWFLSLADARHKCEAWRHDYNNVRPRNFLGKQTPAERLSASGQTSLP